MSAELMLIDLPYIGHSTFHANGPETAPEQVAKQIVVRVQQLAANHPHAAVCCDSSKSFRRELDPTYKAQRETEHRAAIAHIMALACDALRADGFPVWAAEGYEADDVIATAVRQCVEMDGTALILSSDKDLLQLVSDRVTVRGLRDDKGKLTNDGTVMDPAAVLAKLGVRPDQVRDYLSLTGDGSDNVKGANGIGKVKAAELLKQHGTLDAVYESMTHGVVPGITPAMRTSLLEFRDRERFIDDATGSKPVGLAHVRTLLTLRTDAPIPFHEIASERTPRMGDFRYAEQAIGPDDFPGSDEGSHLTSNKSADTLRRELREAINNADRRPDAQSVDAASAAMREAIGRVTQGPTLPVVRRVPEPVIDDEQMALIKRTVAAGATNDELQLYIYDCKRRGVHPLDRLLHFTKRNGKYTPITSIDFLRTRAHDTGKCAGITDPHFSGEPKRAGFAATVVVKRVVDGVMAEFGATARWEEYKPQSNDFMWTKMPFTMLGKCAEALALRKAFPQELSGLYTGDEMAQAGVFTQDVED